MAQIRLETGVSYTDPRKKKVPERGSGLRPSKKNFREGVPLQKYPWV
jgi:hypothetical protein